MVWRSSWICLIFVWKWEKLCPNCFYKLNKKQNLVNISLITIFNVWQKSPRACLMQFGMLVYKIHLDSLYVCPIYTTQPQQHYLRLSLAFKAISSYHSQPGLLLFLSPKRIIWSEFYMIQRNLSRPACKNIFSVSVWLT